MAHGLASIHAAGMVHGDVTLDNAYVDWDEEAGQLHVKVRTLPAAPWCCAIDSLKAALSIHLILHMACIRAVTLLLVTVRLMRMG